MKFLPCLLMLASAAPAQDVVSQMLEQGLAGVVAGMTPVPAKDKADVLAATANLLTKHVTFRSDGTASAYYTRSGRITVEWQKFVISHISGQAVTEADRLNGISKRYLVGFGCDAHRSWDTKTNRWGQWYPIGNVTFPAGIYFEWKDNAWIASESGQLKFFTPGPGLSIAAPEPVGKTSDLPPGMSRGR